MNLSFILNSKDSYIVGKVYVKEGQEVDAGTVLLDIESGKICEKVKAPFPLKVTKLLVKPGDTVTDAQRYLEYEPSVKAEEVHSDGKTETLKFELGNQSQIFTVGRIGVKTGTEIISGTFLFVIESGKLSKPIRAPFNIKITKLLVKEGDEIKDGQPYAEAVHLSDDIYSLRYQEKAKKDEEQDINVDLFVFGAGPGGYEAAIYAAKNGLSVAVAEKNLVGGVCLNVGCIPTKSIIHSADVYRQSREAGKFGIINPLTGYDLKAIIHHKDLVVSTLRGGVITLLQHNKIRLLQGQAEFLDYETAAVKTKDSVVTVHFRNAIIATGSQPAMLNIPGVDYDFVMDSDRLLSNTEDFSSLTVIGGGVIGMEFASIFLTLGKRINVVEFLPDILMNIDNTLTSELKRTLKDKDIAFFTGSKVTRIDKSDDGKAIVCFTKDGKEEKVTSDKVLMAVGRRSVFDGLHLEKAGVALTANKRFIDVDEHMHTNAKGIYAIGDVTGKMQLAHVASHQGFVAVDNIMGKKTVMDYVNVPSVVFTYPEIATVGLSEKQLKEAGRPYKLSHFSFMGNGKALSMDATEGFVKLVEDETTKKVVGAAIIGEDAGNLIATLTVQIKNGLTAQQISDTVFAHPTLAETIHEANMGLGIGYINSND